MKRILLFRIYEFTGKEIGKIREQTKTCFEQHIPKYCIRDNGKPDITVYYHQFTDSTFDKEKYILFDIICGDDYLLEEISQSGYEYLMENVDWNIAFKQASKMSFEKYNKGYIPETNYLVFDLEWIGGGRFDDDGFESIITYLGYLDSNLELKKYETENK